jgi:hypothetical protein
MNDLVKLRSDPLYTIGFIASCIEVAKAAIENDDWDAARDAMVRAEDQLEAFAEARAAESAMN